MLLVVAVRNFINVFTTESLVIVSWNAAGCMFIGEVFSSRRTTRGLDVIDGAFHRAAGRRRA